MSTLADVVGVLDRQIPRWIAAHFVRSRARLTGADTISNTAGQRFFDDDVLRDDDFLRGTLPPARRASDNPIAIACFRLVTFLPDRPLFNVPRLRSCIAFSTFFDAFLPYFAIGPPSVGLSAV